MKRNTLLTNKNKQVPSWLLRIGLSIMFLYAAISSFVTPNDWVGYLPTMLTDHIAGTTALKFFSVYEIALAVWLLSGMFIRYAALLSALTFGGIVVTNYHLLPISFRDIGLMFAALALAVLPTDE